MLLIRNQDELSALVEHLGFLPFFKNDVAGFSVEERIDPALWFAKGQDGPWEWKGPVIQDIHCAYGKLFRGKAGFVSRAWYPDLANYRRDGYDFEALYDDGMARLTDKAVYDLFDRAGPLLVRDAKRLSGFNRDSRERPKSRNGFDPIMTRLQMQCYVTVVRFEYALDKFGHPYGWGLARCDTPEHFFGADFAEASYARTPEESLARILAHLSTALPDANPLSLRHLMQR